MLRKNYAAGNFFAMLFGKDRNDWLSVEMWDVARLAGRVGDCRPTTEAGYEERNHSWITETDPRWVIEYHEGGDNRAYVDNRIQSRVSSGCARHSCLDFAAQWRSCYD
jgi:hypothetical protein